MGVTRKERLLKAMLNDNAEACRGGVSREERIIASVSKKVCDNDALEGGGGTGGGGGSGGGVVMIDGAIIDEEMNCQLSRSYAEIRELYAADTFMVARINLGETVAILPLTAYTEDGIECSFSFGVAISGTSVRLIVHDTRVYIEMDMPEE